MKFNRAAVPSTPDSYFPCDAPAVGRTLPGRRRAGTITGCATPSKARPREVQWWVGLPVLGFPIRKSTAARRIRDHGKPKRKDPPGDVAQAVSFALANDRDHIPAPTGLEFPHVIGSSRCDPEHKVWARFAARLRDAQDNAGERAAMEVPEDASVEVYERAVQRFTAQDLATDVDYDAWLDAERGCAEGWLARESKRKPRAQFSQQRETAQRRQRAKVEGVDMSGAEWLDTLRSREHKPKKRKR